MTNLENDRRLDIGIWVDLPPGARWANEGLARLLGFIVEGAASIAGPRFHVMTSREMHASIREDFLSLKATENVDWFIHFPLTDEESEPSHRYDRDSVNDTASAARRKNGTSPAKAAGQSGTDTGNNSVAVKHPSQNQDSLLARTTCVSEAANRALHAATLAYRRLTTELSNRFSSGKTGPATQNSDTLPPELRQIREMAAYANSRVPVDGWLVFHPLFRGPELLNEPRAIVFADALSLVFPVTEAALWSDTGALTQARNRLREVLTSTPAIVCFSRHVADDIFNVMGVRHPNVHVIPHAAPSVSDFLPYLRAAPPLSSPSSLRHAADVLRATALSKSNKYMASFAFEDSKYFVVSTQDRVTKNIGLAVEATLKLLRRDMQDVKMITTAPIHWGQAWTRLPSLIEDNMLMMDVVSMHDLPRPAHAALYHCAQLAVHPSFFEGGQSVFPFFEALSVGCPCIMARGPHTEEAMSSEPELERYLFDPYDPDSLAHMIKSVILDRDAVLDHQLSILKRIRRRTWGDVARAYGDAAVSGRQRPLLAENDRQ